MTTRKTRVRQLNSQATASMRILKRMGAMLERQLTAAVHPIISLADVRTLVSTAKAMDQTARSLCVQIGLVPVGADEAIIAFFELQETQKTGREFDRLRTVLKQATEHWDDDRRLGREQIEAYEPTALTLRQRAMNHLFTALCQQAEAHNHCLHGLLYAHYLQFWVWDDKFQYSGQKQTD